MGLYAQFGDPDTDSDYIEGSCQITPYVKWFELSSLQLERPSPKYMNSGGQKPTDKNHRRAIWITLPVDEKTPLFFQASANGTIFKTITIELIKEHQSTTQLKLSEVAIASIQMSASHDPGTPSSVVIELNFTKSSFDYKADPNQPASGHPLEMGWDVMSNQKL